jgi:hypothetical protein
VNPYGYHSTSLGAPLTSPLYSSFRYRPETHPDGLKQSGRRPLHFAYSGWRSGEVAPLARFPSWIQVEQTCIKENTVYCAILKK